MLLFLLYAGVHDEEASERLLCQRDVLGWLKRERYICGPCRWPSITEWEMYITAQGCRLRNDLYCLEWDVKLYYTIPSSSRG